MPKIVADPPSSSCFRLFSAFGIVGSQWLSPDLFLLRVRGAGVLRRNATSPQLGPADRAGSLFDAMQGWCHSALPWSMDLTSVERFERQP
jgi:hypothetical protein